MKCKKCGVPIKKGDLFCGNCGMRIGSKAKKGKHRHSGLIIIPIMLLLGAALFFAQLRFGLVSSAFRYKEIRGEAEKISRYFSVGDLDGIQELLFSEPLNGQNVISEQTGQEEESVAAAVLKQTRVELKDINIFSKTATYRIIAPDMSRFVQDYAADSKSSTEDMLSYLADYASGFDSRFRTEVAVNYSLGEKIYFVYNVPDFLDGITGGLLSSYGDFYRDTVEAAVEEAESLNEA